MSLVVFACIFKKNGEFLTNAMMLLKIEPILFLSWLAMAQCCLAQKAPAPAEMKLAALPLRAVAPVDNPSTAAKVELGRLLFFDPLLSATKTVACATCHHPRHGWADGRATALGVGGRGIGPERLPVNTAGISPLPRNTPGLLNVAFNGLVSGQVYEPENAPMFWDGRASSLEAQVFHPIRSQAEMRGNACSESEALVEMVRRVESVAGYRKRFSKVFGDRERGGVTAENVAAAIAAFERTLVGGDAPFDRFLRGDQSAMTVQQQRGMKTFEKAGCVHCHGGPIFSDFKLHFIDVTGTGGDDRQPMRTPTLRNLRHTAPYLHHGRMRSLEEVMIFYEKLMDAAAEVLDGGAETDPPFDPLLKHLHLEAEDFEDVLAFLDALNDEDYDQSVPESVPSGLVVGGE